MSAKNLDTKAGFSIGQEGEFTVFDAFHRPIETIQGRIIRLMEGKEALYAMIETVETGIIVRPARLADLQGEERA